MSKVLENHALIRKYKDQCENDSDKKCLLLYTNWLREQGYITISQGQFTDWEKAVELADKQINRKEC